MKNENTRKSGRPRLLETRPPRGDEKLHYQNRVQLLSIFARGDQTIDVETVFDKVEINDVRDAIWDTAKLIDDEILKYHGEDTYHSVYHFLSCTLAAMMAHGSQKRAQGCLADFATLVKRMSDDRKDNYFPTFYDTEQ